MSDKILFKRGLEADLPLLAEGEFGFCTDSKKLFIGSDVGNILINGTPITPPDPNTSIVSNGLLWYWNAKDGIKNGNQLVNLAPEKEAKVMTVYGSSVNPSDGSIVIPPESTNYVEFQSTGHMAILGNSWTAEMLFTPNGANGEGARELISGGTFMDSWMGVTWGDLKKEFHQSTTTREPKVIVAATPVNEVSSPELMSVTYCYNKTTREMKVYINGAIRHSEVLLADSIFAPTTSPIFLFRGIWGTAFQANFHSFRYYERALTDQEVAQNFLIGKELGVSPSSENPTDPTDPTEPTDSVHEYILIQDSFEREGVTLGFADTGQEWQLHNTSGEAVYETINGQAVMTDGGGHGSRNFAYIDAGTSDVSVKVTNATPYQGGIIFRAKDQSNPVEFLRLRAMATGFYELAYYKGSTADGLEPAVTTVYGNSSIPVVSGDVVEVRAIGTSVKVYINGVLGIEAAITELQTETLVGINGGFGSLHYFDDFIVSSLLNGTTPVDEGIVTSNETIKVWVGGIES